MIVETTSLQLFGLDLRAMWRQYCAAWKTLGNSWLVTALARPIPVRVLRQAGAVGRWLGASWDKSDRADLPATFEAIEVPEEFVLRKVLNLPGMAPDDTLQALEMEARSASPFPVADLTWAWNEIGVQATGQRAIEMLLASRRQIATCVQAQQPRLRQPREHIPEVWVFSSNGAPVVLPGWGEQRRRHALALQRRQAFGLIAMALVIVVGMAITPSLQLRARSLEAISALTALQQKTAPLVAQREGFMQSVQQLQAVRTLLHERVNTPKVLAALTQAMPDNTFVQGLQIQGMKVTVQGVTADAAVLMQTLGSVAGFKDVRAPAAATRRPGANSENFHIEIQLDPSVHALVPEPEPEGMEPSRQTPPDKASHPDPAGSKP